MIITLVQGVVFMCLIFEFQITVIAFFIGTDMFFPLMIV